MERVTHLRAISLFVRKVPVRSHALLEVIRDDALRPVLMQAQMVISRLNLTRVVLILLVSNRRLAPRVVVALCEINTHPRVGDEPVVDLRAVDRVRAIGETRGAPGCRVHFALVGATRTTKLGNAELPTAWESADAFGGGCGYCDSGREANEAEGGGVLHRAVGIELSREVKSRLSVCSS
jgi:hypothetical protein